MEPEDRGVSTKAKFEQLWPDAQGFLKPNGAEEFRRAFQQNLVECVWKPHLLYSVFTQYDKEWYLANEEAYRHKYRCFYAVSKTIAPQSIIELGTCAGSSSDAYLSAAPEASYIGLDVFGVNFRKTNNERWDPYEIAVELLTGRGFKNWQLIRGNLRHLQELPAQAQLVVVDAAHDFENEYEDLKLALTANPEFIFVDDADDENGAKPAIEKFLKEDLQGRVEYTVGIPYVGGGLVIKLAN